MIGKVLDNRYRIVSQLGQGGMGSVYLAEHAVLGKRVAVKVLRSDYSSREDLVQRFKQEAINASQIGHENIVDVTDFGNTPDGQVYFVMEAISGESLAQLVSREGALPIPRVLAILAQMCSALAAAHSRGIIHRDLKTDNIMIVRREDGSELVKVLDFGISKMTDAQMTAGRITQVGAIMGTPNYMAPEQATTSQVNHRADIYALGVVAYELVTGALPFEAPSDVAVLMMHQTDVPQPPTQRRPDLPIPSSLEETILMALAKRPEDRQQSMAELGQQLNQTMLELGLAPLRSPTLPPMVQGISPTRAATPTPRTRGTPSRPHEETEPPTAASVRRASKTDPSTDALTEAEVRAIRPGPAKGAIVAVLVAILVGGGAAWLALRSTAAPAEVVRAAPAPTVPPPDAVPPLPPTVAAAPALPKPKSVALSSVPTGAQVYENDRQIGSTPMRVQVAPGGRSLLQFRLPGHRVVSKTVTADDDNVQVRLSKTRPELPYGKVDDLKNPFK